MVIEIKDTKREIICMETIEILEMTDLETEMTVIEIEKTTIGREMIVIEIEVANIGTEIETIQTEILPNDSLNPKGTGKRETTLHLTKTEILHQEDPE